jgi:hypothetical protein
MRKTRRPHRREHTEKVSLLFRYLTEYEHLKTNPRYEAFIVGYDLGLGVIGLLETSRFMLKSADTVGCIGSPYVVVPATFECRITLYASERAIRGRGYLNGPGFRERWYW